jgi:glycosyltransferase 2 family protein
MPSLPRKLFLAALILVLLAVIAYSLRGALHSSFSWTRVGEAIANIRISFVLGSVAAVFLAYATRTLRWNRFCRWFGKCTFADSFGATLMGFAGVCLLSRAGEPLRPVLMAHKCRFRVATMFGIWLLERLFDLGAAAVLLVLSLFLPSQLLSNEAGAPAWEGKLRLAGALVAAGLAVALAAIVYLRLHGAALIDRLFANWRARSGWRQRLAKQFSDFSEGLQAIRTFGDFSAAAFYSAVHWFLIVVDYDLIVRSFGGRFGQFDLRAAMMLVVVSLFGSVLQLPGVGGGGQILAFIGMTQIFALQKEPAAAAAMLLWIVNGVAVCLPGVPLLIREGLSVASLRRLAHAEVEAEKVGAHISPQQ